MNHQPEETSHNSSTTIKSWAPDDRPREKLLIKGKEALSDSELLAIILQTGSGKKTAVDLAKEILQKCNNSLSKLSKRSLESLMETKGIGKAKAISVIAAMELGRRREATNTFTHSQVNKSKDVADYLQPLFKDLQREIFAVVFLNARNAVLHYEIMNTGGITFSMVDSRLIFQRALELKAVKLILCHNHPSGSLKPSSNDESLTNRLVEAGKIMDIQITDHIIVSEEGYYSFADNGKI